ncbi:diguanylate cyclase [Pseudomonas pudica]|uniref:diguanylate cyclase n=1 Tax=Pseudomonas pudica TaxID=272772 RepID=A0ABS0FUN5_9PSED|nr:diguanylate cyclase [Pseudomonas pudica]MBF8644044.1 diguanylate cyclase [Pseudomonas pudica]MBF8758589.1 diguanylate cyclase [Pseudomonas pudica]
MDEISTQLLMKAEDDTVIVLVVDDQPMIGEAVRRYLAGESNVQFHYCADATQAVAEAEKISPTVILQDLVMPGVDGFSLIKNYKNTTKTRNVPIVALSTKEDPVIKSRAFEVGCSDYLVKLPDPIELLARLRYHSRSFNSALQRDEAYRALRVSQQQLLDTNLALQRANNELQRLINSDGLTGLSNRRHFDEFLDTHWRREGNENLEISLLMIDVDFFKVFNDRFGHVAGDEALKCVASAVRDTIVNASYLPARYGGEEFAAILPGASSDEGKAIAEQLRAKVELLHMPHCSPSANSVVTVSIGLATFAPKRLGSSKMLIECADKALYLAKSRGRNQVAIYRESEF